MALTATRAELAGIIAEKTMHVTDANELISAVAAFITTESKPVDIESLMRDVMQYRLERGIVEAVAVSAHPITPTVVADVKALLKEHFPEAEHIRVDSRIDSGVVGGVRIELPRETLDLSIRSKLNIFKRIVARERN